MKRKRKGREEGGEERRREGLKRLHPDPFQSGEYAGVAQAVREGALGAQDCGWSVRSTDVSANRERCVTPGTACLEE